VHGEGRGVGLITLQAKGHQAREKFAWGFIFIILRCGEKTEVFSRIVGYYRPVSRWNISKQGEYKDRVVFTKL